MICYFHFIHFSLLDVLKLASFHFCFLVLQKSSMKLLSRVTPRFDSANSPSGLKNHQRNFFHGWPLDGTAQTAPLASQIINETASTGDAWIRQREQPLGTTKSSTKLLRRVTHGFYSAISPYGLRNHQWNCFHGCRVDLTAQTAPRD